MTQGTNYLNESRGLKSWLFTVDHKRIGVMYFWSLMTAVTKLSISS